MKAKNYEIKKSKDNSFIITFVATSAEVEKHQQEVLLKVQKDFDLKGFRKGNVPLDVLKQHVDKGRILEEAASHVISDRYNQIIEEEQLHPIIQPQVKVQNAPITEGKDWQIEIQGCEVPPVEINPIFKDEIKKLNSTPKKETDKSKNNPADQNIDQILDVLVKNTKVELPEILIEAEIQSHLSRLIDQTQAAGVSVEQYLKSKKITPKEYQNQIKTQVTTEWSINLAFGQIAKNEKMTIEKEEVDNLLQKNPQMAQNMNLVYYLIQQQKVIDYLKSL